MTKRVLILTSDMGFGHRSAANAIDTALRLAYPSLQTQIINPMDHPKVPSFYRDNPEAYDVIVKHMPEFYNFTYRAVDHPLTSTLVENVNTTMLIEAMLDILNDARPDVIVVTRENYLSTLWAISKFTRRRIPVVTVVTDLGTVHRIWFNTVSAITCVPNRRVYEVGLSEKMPAERLRITGIPVHPRLAAETRTQAELRAELGWQPHKTTVLIVGGSRVKNVREAAAVLNHCNQDVQLAVVAGGDDALYHDLQQMEWHVPTVLYNFVQNMPQLLKASDALVCKAGGLMVTEGLACGLPILLIDAIEGQETGNVEYVEDHGAGAFITSHLMLLETLYDWLSDGAAGLALRAERARQIGYPQAASDIAALVYGYAVGALALPAASSREQRERKPTEDLRTWLGKFLNDQRT